jgi:hypothetical protein
VSPSDTQPAGFRDRRVLLSLFCVSLTTTGAALVWPRLAGAVDSAGAAARGSDPRLLCLAGFLFAAGPASCGLLWRHAIVQAGGRLSPVQACARYRVGSLVNSFAPCHLGDAVRTALLCQALPSRTPRRIVGCLGFVQGVRAATLGALALACWVPAQLTLLSGLGALTTILVYRRQARLIVLAALGPATKVAAVAVALVALDVPEPFGASLAIVPALGLAALLPLTPANLGAASVAISLVLHARGVHLGAAMPASIVVHGIETAAGVVFGAGSAVFLLTPRIAHGAGSVGNRSAQAYRLV